MVRYEHSKAEAMSRYSDSCLVVLGRQFCVRRLFETLRDSGFGVISYNAALSCCNFDLWQVCRQPTTARAPPEAWYVDAVPAPSRSLAWVAHLGVWSPRFYLGVNASMSFSYIYLRLTGKGMAVE
jgi:hypothetical protein